MSGIFDLTGRTALVTGGTRGLGRAMAGGLTRAGARVMVTGRKPDACELAAKELSAETGAEVVATACHMGDWEQIGALADTAYERFGTLDVLVNNAGINPALTPLADVSEAYWDKLYAVNVKGPMRLASLVAPRMGEAGGGSIVNVITVGAYGGGPGVGTYTSAKAALLNLTRVMAFEWAPLGVASTRWPRGPS